jgi:hypothetical protein
MKKLIILAMMLGLFMVGTARADGAWILWYKYDQISYYPKSTINKEAIFIDSFFEHLYPWELVEAFPTYGACQKVLQEKLEYQGKWFTPYTIPSSKVSEEWEPIKVEVLKGTSDIMIHIYQKNGGFDKYYMKWKCLPESVDPRK